MTGDKFGADLFCHVNRNGETQSAIHAVDQRVHANHFAVDVAERAAAVARVDRRVGLQIIRNGVAAGSQ